MNTNIAIVYFSATNVTQTYVKIIRDVLLDRGCEVNLYDVTSFDSRTKPLVDDEIKNFIFGFPVYDNFAPGVINSWLPRLEGHGKRCTMLFTFGGRTSGYAHYHTKKLLEQVGFQVLFSAEFLGKHSYNYAGWSVLSERPDVQDFRVAREYAHLAIERFSQDHPPVFRLQKPFSYSRTILAQSKKEKRTERRWPQPYRNIEDCQMCYKCETACPTLAFDAAFGLSDIENCIFCMRCVAICPDNVITVYQNRKFSHEMFLDYCDLTEEMLKQKRSKIITAAWQAAS
ncbi:MAG: 4Fe-4S binding protein [Chloroflexota bacterium]|nr:4Fe-4S binding protein [Chloroflexota bacterium]